MSKDYEFKKEILENGVIRTTLVYLSDTKKEKTDKKDKNNSKSINE